jgi:hypothetical protein
VLAVGAVSAAALLDACGAGRSEAALPPVVVAPAGAAPRAAPGPAAAARTDSVGVRRGTREGDRRFLITDVGDSTVTMLAPGDRWLRAGTYGIVVDPRRRDALVGRLYVQSREADTVVALVTGQTTRMTADYAAIFRSPVTPLLRQRSFWGGVATGVAVGATAVMAAVLAR